MIGVKLRVGVDLLGDPVPRDPALIDRFIAVDRSRHQADHRPRW